MDWARSSNRWTIKKGAVEKFRMELGLSREELAQRARLSYQTVYRYERPEGATLRWETLLTLAKALRVDPSLVATAPAGTTPEIVPTSPASTSPDVVAPDGQPPIPLPLGALTRFAAWERQIGVAGLIDASGRELLGFDLLKRALTAPAILHGVSCWVSGLVVDMMGQTANIAQRLGSDEDPDRTGRFLLVRPVGREATPTDRRLPADATEPLFYATVHTRHEHHTTALLACYRQVPTPTVTLRCTIWWRPIGYHPEFVRGRAM